jgi:signal transduction histidine kinase
VSSEVTQPAPWRSAVLRPWRRSRGELLYDATLAFVLVAVAVLEALILDGTEQDGPPSLAFTIVLGAATAIGAVAARRRWPILSLIAVSSIGSWLGACVVLSLFASYTAGYRVISAARLAAAVAFAAIVPTAFGWFLVLRYRGPEPDLALILALVLAVMAVSALVGRYWRQRTALVAAGWERAGRLEREQSLIADQARLRERSRIAQDMHDSLGHELSLIALQAGALELDGDLPERHRETARLLRATTADAVARLREIVGVLREDGEPAPTEPATEGVAGLVERAAAAGLEVRLEQDRQPGPLPPLVDRALYRVVQESVTNATKHAPGAPVVVRLRYGPDEVTVEVTNGPARDQAPEPGEDGRGLIGLGERVRLAGGQLTVGSHGDGFRVRARLPVRGDGQASSGPAVADGGAAAPTDAGQLPRFTAPRGEVALVDGYVSMRARLRRRFWLKLAVPVVLLAIFVAGSLVVAQLRIATLSLDDWDTVRVGETHVSVSKRLPSGTPSPPQGFGPYPPPPAGTDCSYFVPRSGAWWEFAGYDGTRTFRVCYADGRVVARDVLYRARP